MECLYKEFGVEAVLPADLAAQQGKRGPITVFTLA
jgi:hypothetical protein